MIIHHDTMTTHPDLAELTPTQLEMWKDVVDHKLSRTVGRETVNEFIRQCELWGPGRHNPNTADEVDPALLLTALTSSEHHGLPSESDQKKVVDRATVLGVLTWADILIEEVVEAVNESDAAKRRVELIQIAAVCWSWIVDLKRQELGLQK